jgi:hypothetical protein
MVLTKEIIQQLVAEHTRLTIYLTSEDCESLANAINTLTTEACGSGEAVTFYSYIDANTGVVKGESVQNIEIGDKLYLRPHVSAVPDGWKLIPIDPPIEMIEGFWGEIKHGDEEIAAAKEAYAEMLLFAPQPPIQVSVAPDKWLKAMKLAMAICDSVPTKLHESEDPTLRNIGLLVNAHEGVHGYAIIRDALEDMKNYKFENIFQILKHVSHLNSFREFNDYLPVIRSALSAAPQPAKEVSEEVFNGWYCAHCQHGVDPSEVTFHETHTVCGRKISDDVPPKHPRITEQDARGIIRETFLANGFTIKEGCTDLKPYVYDAAFALLDKLNEVKL